MNDRRPNPRRRKRLAILTNTIAPYRIPIYAALSERFDAVVFHGGNERDRKWDLEIPASLKTQRVWGIQISSKKETGVQGLLDGRNIHLNFGLLWQLPLYRPECILTNEMGLRTLIALIYGRLASIPVWVWWGGTLHSERHVGVVRRCIRSVIRRLSKRWVSYGTTSTEYLLSLGVHRNGILQIQNCVPQETFVNIPGERSEWFKGEPRPVILSVGRLIPLKGLDTLIDACGRLAERDFEFTLVIVGQGPERDRLFEMARKNHIRNFHIVPNQPQATLNEIYRAADVFIFPTMDDVWGLVVNEALWAGTPVLCSKYAGCGLELLPESNLFDPCSPESFEGALAKVFRHSLAPPDHSRLRTWQEVSEMLTRSLESGLPVC